MNKLTTNRGFWNYLGFSIITFGIYGLYLMYAFAKETNLACKGDGKETQGLLPLILLSCITFGIYGIVWYVRLIDRRGLYLAKHNKPQVIDVKSYLLTLFLWSWLTLGIMAIVLQCRLLYQQNEVNKTYNEINNISG